MNTKSESSLNNTKIVYDITKFTHLDYPNQLACIIWFAGCNMRCDYCYNPEIVLAKNAYYSLLDILEFLKTRVGLLNGVVLSGGEATSYELVEFCKEIKNLGFLIKLDTNGTNYNRVKKLVDLNLIDYIALDYKAPLHKFIEITHSNRYKEFSKTLEYLVHNSIKFEVRTTLHPDLLNVNDINLIINDLKSRGYKGKYYLQKFLESESNLGNLQKPKSSFNEKLLSNEIEIVWR